MLEYKCDDAGIWFKEIDEAYSTQECSCCAARTGPRGREGLAVRRGTCPACRAEHERDHNASCNIKARGLAWLELEFAVARASATKKAGARDAPAAAGHGRPAVGIPALCA